MFGIKRCVDRKSSPLINCGTFEVTTDMVSIIFVKEKRNCSGDENEKEKQGNETAFADSELLAHKTYQYLQPWHFF